MTSILQTFLYLDLKMYSFAYIDSIVSGTRLPTCLQLKIIQISPDQKSRDSTLPRLLYELDEACKKYSNDAEKSRLANSCMQAASSPKRKYRILDYFELLGNNKVVVHYS